MNRTQMQGDNASVWKGQGTAAPLVPAATNSPELEVKECRPGSRGAQNPTQTLSLACFAYFGRGRVFAHRSARSRPAFPSHQPTIRTRFHRHYLEQSLQTMAHYLQRR